MQVQWCVFVHKEADGQISRSRKSKVTKVSVLKNLRKLICVIQDLKPKFIASLQTSMTVPKPTHNVQFSKTTTSRQNSGKTNARIQILNVHTFQPHPRIQHQNSSSHSLHSLTVHTHQSTKNHRMHPQHMNTENPSTCNQKQLQCLTC